MTFASKLVIETLYKFLKKDLIFSSVMYLFIYYKLLYLSVKKAREILIDESVM